MKPFVTSASARKRHLKLIASTTAISTAFMVFAGFPAAMAAQSGAAAPSVDEEIVVTGSRIVREGYEAPTPLTVFGAEQMEQNAAPSLMTMLSEIPALSGSMLTTSNIVTQQGQLGNQNANLRSLGANRVLVLLDGQRTVGASYAGVPDIGTFPQQLVTRVDVVTGGASAVYGSDAVAGVMNFVLDRTFTGVKGEISGGLTNYGDDRNYKVNLSAGFPFAAGRGHVLLSGEHMHNDGVQGTRDRDWAHAGANQFANPTYTATNGQPQQLWFTDNTGTAHVAPGGIITSGPLKGTAFGDGGVPYQYNYGSLYSNPYIVGGDWDVSNMRYNNDPDPAQEINSLFTRISYDLTDNLNAYVQYGYAQMRANTNLNTVWIVGGSPQGLTINADNAYLPASVRAAMVANNITQFQMGTANVDKGFVGNDNLYITNRAIVGLEGMFDAFGTEWNWNANYAHGTTMMKAIVFGGMVLSHYRNAADAVYNASGQIVCRISLSIPNHPCRPWNVMGVGVNAGNTQAKEYIEQPNFQRGLIKQVTYAASITGEPFQVPAGPVSLAFSAEHRADSIHVAADRFSLVADRPFAIVPGLDGEQSVTEGAVETVIPLVQGKAWAQNWDFTAAARLTDYELSGFVTTYKFGSTYTPIDDIKFRVTYSRDIRAPNLQELFASTNAAGGNPQINDRAQNRSYPLGLQLQVSNPNLSPEKANTIGIGAVFSPAFLEGFTASVDFWDVNVKGAIQAITVQQTIDSCFSGQFPELCSKIVRDPVTTNITTVSISPINLATKNVRGIDLESSYRMPVSELVSSWDGNLSLHGLMTIYLRNYEDNTFNLPTNRVGENSGANPPYWKIHGTVSYTLDPMTVSLTGRAVSSGRISSEYIECTTGCPTSTPDRTTINNNHLPGRAYLDANVSYDFGLGEEATGEVFLSVKNIFNTDPPAAPASFFYSVSNLTVLYDKLGTVYRAGVRFRM